MYICLGSSCVYRLFDARNAGNVVIDIIKWSYFIDCQMYICLISSCIYRLLHAENAGNAVIDIIIEWCSFIDCQM